MKKLLQIGLSNLATRVGCMVLLLVLFQPLKAQNWMPKGQVIDGDSAGEKVGYTLDISADGNTIAYGTWAASGDSAHIRVLMWDGANWMQKGDDIMSPDNQNIYVCGLSANGNTVILGAPYYSGGVSGRGIVQVYEWVNNAWIQKGADIYGDATQHHFGYSASINNDGTLIAIGTPYDDTGGYQRGRVKVYQWTGAAWSLLGAPISGESAGDFSGFRVALSSHDTVVAIGAIYNAGNGFNAGHVRVFDWVDTAWVQKGGDIDGYASDLMGYVDIDAYGNTVIAGSIYNDSVYSNSGIVRVFEWNGTAWSQKGQAINGDWPDDYLGTSVSINADGSVISMGASSGQSTIFSNPEPGYVKIYAWNNTWVQSGSTFYGVAHGDQCGTNVALNANGKCMAAGSASANNLAGNKSGHIRAFFTCDTSFATLAITACFSYTVPSGNATYTASGTYMDTVTNYTGCDSIMTINLTINTVDVAVNVTGVTLTAAATSAGYQWLDCTNNMVAISGATSQSFTPTANGNYAVEVTENGCVDTSACYPITTIGMDESANNRITVYPNPTKGTFVLASRQDLLPVTVSLYHISGKLMFTKVVRDAKAEININGPAGMYILKLERADGYTTILRLIKE